MNAAPVPRIFFICVAIVISFCFPPLCALGGGIGIERVEVVENGVKTIEKGGGGSAGVRTSKGFLMAAVTTQQNSHRMLQITLRNPVQGTAGEIVLRHWYFARDVASAKEFVIGGADQKITLAQGASKTFTTEPHQFSVTVENSIQSPTKRGSTVQHTPPSGTRFAGYGVQVLQGGKVLATEFSPEEFMKLVGASFKSEGAPFHQKGDGVKGRKAVLRRR